MNSSQIGSSQSYQDKEARGKSVMAVIALIGLATLGVWYSSRRGWISL